MNRNPFARTKHLLDDQALYSGEGELHAHLRALGMTSSEFCALVGIQESTFSRWYGHPLHAWPIEFLRYYGWAKGMAEFLRTKGWNPDKLKPELPTRLRNEGRYPRKKGDLDLSNVPIGNYSPLDRF